MSFQLASLRLGARSGFSTATAAAYQTTIRRTMATNTNNNTDTIIFGRKVEKRFFYSVLAILGTVEGYFYYSTYFKGNDSSTTEQNKTIESNSVNTSK